MTGIDLAHVHTLCECIATRVTLCRNHMMNNERDIGTYNHENVHTTMEITIEKPKY